tara:strand:+ start:86 stop:853 length:768 start_codon:yes stop_codon:yes gene_type:complete
MSINFKNAIVRLPSESIINAISSKGLSPNFLKAKEQHQAYIDILKKTGLDVKILNPLKYLPDSLFVEDPALIYNKICIILKPGVVTRFEEASKLKIEISELFDQFFTIEDGYIEGGDILRINNHFIIGISSRTDENGANSLKKIIEKNGGTSEIAITPDNILHFKSECSLLDEETILATKNLIETGFFDKKYRIIKVPDSEENGANCLRINEQLLVPKGYPKLLDILSKDYKVRVLDVTEMEKVDAGLSCLSLRW